MTAVATLAGAPCYDVVTDWNQINWKKVNRNVRRLQARIVKAIEEGRWGKVKALQRLLTHSFSGKALAVRRVTERLFYHRVLPQGVNGGSSHAR